ncbi:MAG TPA: outer membrane beta-barrel protein [Verrucomicrobiae bacterium]|nr:outer membrane beta-barrel protein [Verrucomicrobiae bacterium]
MKFNKWTLGLAALGVVSLATAARADENMSALQTAFSNTTISGSVSASFNWELSPGGNSAADSPYGGIPFQYGASKQDGFNLDVVRLTIAKPEDASPWASGYDIDLMFGPDAVDYNSSWNGSSGQDFAIKQAYVTLRTPVGNGIDWKVGVFDTIIGYEVTDAGNDPNYTRSWGYAIEPTEHTGILATYAVNSDFSLSAGIANTLMAGINARAYEYGKPGYYDYYQNDWNKTYMASATYTAPSSWGPMAGSSFYAGIVYGFNSAPSQYAGHGFHQGGDQVNYYLGATLNTPIKQLTTGLAFDYADNFGGGGTWFDGYHTLDVWTLGLYATYKATDKLSFNARGEYVHGDENVKSSVFDYNYDDVADGYELTGTVEYDLWANVVSRLELRWDHANSHYSPLDPGDYNDSYIDNRDSLGFYANVIYKF